MYIYYKIITGQGWIKAEESELKQKIANRNEFAAQHSDVPGLKIKRIVKITEEDIDIDSIK